MNNEFGIILAGGIGARFGSSVPKQYIKLNGREIVSYSVEAFQKSRLNQNFVLVCDESEYKEQNIIRKYKIPCVQGGSTRNESIYNGLQYVKKFYPETEKIFIHDAARPFINSSIINTYLDLLKNGNRAVVTAVKITDFLGSNKENILVNREDFFLIQAPEVFDFPYLMKYFKKDFQQTTPLHQLPRDTKFEKYFDFKYNLKITYPEDLPVAEQYFRFILNNSTANNSK